LLVSYYLFQSGKDEKIYTNEVARP